MPEARQIAQKLRNSETQNFRTEIRRILGLCFGESKKPVQHRGVGELSRLAKQPRSGCGLDWSEATQRSVVGVQVLAVGVACTPATWRTGCGAKPHGVSKTLGGRAVGECAIGTPQTQVLVDTQKDAPSAPSKGFRG